MRILVTGGAGFIGSNYARLRLAAHPDDSVTVLDKLTYAGNLENLAGLAETAGKRFRFVRADIADPEAVESLFAEPGGFDLVVNFAAESHVDRSIHDPRVFLSTNIFGTQVLLECAHRHGTALFVQVSTDEVYGSLGPTGAFTETTPLAPNSPYSASKAGADLIARAYHETFRLPVIITRSSNNYGPYQFPEKLIPLLVTNAIEDRELPIYGDGLHVRDWIHVEDNCRAIDAAIRGRVGEVYNIGGSAERTNLDIARMVLRALGKPESLLRFVKDRPGHDRRYAMDTTKLRAETGWAPRVRAEDGIAETVHWYAENQGWWRRVRDGSYRTFYEKQYVRERGLAV